MKWSLRNVVPDERLNEVNEPAPATWTFQHIFVLLYFLHR